MGPGYTVAGHISYKGEMITEEGFRNLRSVLDAYGPPITVDGLIWDEAYIAAKNDKKVGVDTAKFIPLRSIGGVYVDRIVSSDEMKGEFDCIGRHKG